MVHCILNHMKAFVYAAFDDINNNQHNDTSIYHLCMLIVSSKQKAENNENQFEREIIHPTRQ